MNNLLKLYTYWNDLTWNIVETEEDEPNILMSRILLRDGEKVVIHEMKCPFEDEDDDDEDEVLFVISGGYVYQDFTSTEEAERFLLELQRNPEKLYQSTEGF